MGMLDGKVALITGAGRGQGRSHALTLAREGADIAICDINEQYDTIPYSMTINNSIEETKKLVEAEGRRCYAAPADVRDSAQVQAWVDAAVAELGGPDILVAQAGVWAPALLVDTSDELWADTMDTNSTGVFYAIRATAPKMIERGGGSIIATASMCGRQGTFNLSAYTASKWAIIGLVKSAALELAEHRIRVNAVNPSLVDSDMLDFQGFHDMFSPELEQATKDSTNEVVMRDHHAMPIGMYPVEEVSKAVLFLASDQSAVISGTALDLNAGKSGNWAV